MVTASLGNLEREFSDMLQRIRRLEEISVPDAAKLLKRSRAFVRENFPIIVHSAKVHGVRLADIEAYQERRTLLPRNGETPRRAA